MSIYQDLLILYKLVFHFKLNRLENTKTYVETHLSELETLAEIYGRKNDLETGSTSVGKTLFFQGSGFNQSTHNYTTTLDLGQINVVPGSKIAFFISGRYFKPESVRFYMGDFSCPPFTLNRDYIKIPGEPKYRRYKYSFPKDIKHDKLNALKLENAKINVKNKYTIFGGKDSVSILSDASKKIVKKKEKESISSINRLGKIEFYIVGGSYADFEFSKKPLSQNFSGNSVQKMTSHKKIVIEYEGPFSFNFVTDGEFYATKKRGTVKNEQLFYPSNDGINDFLIEEYVQNDYKSYKLNAVINQTNEYEPLINMVAVKELSGEESAYD